MTLTPHLLAGPREEFRLQKGPQGLQKRYVYAIFCALAAWPLCEAGLTLACTSMIDTLVVLGVKAICSTSLCVQSSAATATSWMIRS